jgi:hypothetical protein
MQHINIERWLDFVRGVCTKAERRVLQDHLLSPCRECGRQVETLQRILRAAQADMRIPEVPGSMVRFVRELYLLRLPAVQVTPHARTKLVFDSFRSKGTAGGMRATRGMRPRLRKNADTNHVVV